MEKGVTGNKAKLAKQPQTVLYLSISFWDKYATSLLGSG